ncbi:MAG: helix-turn-helix transcriptional regulator [bacterium]|nr:helix-turn-helix transcriptional regulator [bacterium]
MFYLLIISVPFGKVMKKEHDMELQKKTLGKRIRELRKARGLTQEQLAERTDLDYTSIGSLERGIFNPSLNTAGKIAAALGISIQQLITIPAGKPSTEKEKILHHIAERLDKLDPKSLKLVNEFISSILPWLKANKK